MKAAVFRISDFTSNNSCFSTIDDSLTRLINLDASYLGADYHLTQTVYDVFLNNIKSCVARCSFPNWGGDNEECLSDKTKNNINKFIELTEEFMEKIPDIAVTNDGQLSLEWIGEKYESILRINQFGIAFIKTVKDIVTDGENEMQMMISFTESDEKLRRSLYKVMKFVNDEDTL